MKYSKLTNTSRGFTLIEVMVASSIFVVIVMAGTQILITATNNYRTTSEVRQSLDTLNFVMEDMTRNIRLGSTFDCGNLTNIQQAQSCAQGTALGQLGGSFLAFDDPYDGGQVAYWLYSGGDPTKAVLYKKPGSNLTAPPYSTPLASGSPFSPVTPADMFIDLTKSGFSVSDPGGTATPMVTIRLAGTVQYRTTVIPFDIQSTIAPRNLPNL